MHRLYHILFPRQFFQYQWKQTKYQRNAKFREQLHCSLQSADYSDPLQWYARIRDRTSPRCGKFTGHDTPSLSHQCSSPFSGIRRLNSRPHHHYHMTTDSTSLGFVYSVFVFLCACHVHVGVVVAWCDRRILTIQRWESLTNRFLGQSCCSEQLEQWLPPMVGTGKRSCSRRNIPTPTKSTENERAHSRERKPPRVSAWSIDVGNQTTTNLEAHWWEKQGRRTFQTIYYYSSQPINKLDSQFGLLSETDTSG